MQVVIDADVLYGGTTRALLLYLDHHGVIRVRWSALLIVEASRALVKTGRLTRDAAVRTVDLMSRAAPDADVPVLDVQRAFRRAWPGVRDAKDLHVAACAVVVHDQAAAAGAPAPVYLLTKNTKDFAPRKLAALGILQLHPDVFLHDLWRRDGARMATAFDAFREDLPERPEASRVLHKLASDGQRKTAMAMAVAL
ncbi:MAG: PIN domain-containing protein [Burkholderiaceae bacterium]